MTKQFPIETEVDYHRTESLLRLFESALATDPDPQYIRACAFDVCEHYANQGVAYSLDVCRFLRRHLQDAPLLTMVETAFVSRALSIDTAGRLRLAIVDIISRADDLRKVYSYALEAFGERQKMPAAIKKGIGDAFNKFDERQFAAYDDPTGELSFKRLIYATHPTPKDEAQSNLFIQVKLNLLTLPKTFCVDEPQQPPPKLELWNEFSSSRQPGELGYALRL